MSRKTDKQQAQSQSVGPEVHQVLESISDAFFSLDREWRFTYLNKAAERLLRRTRDQLLGKRVWEEFPEATDTAAYHESHKALAEQITVQFEQFYPPLDAWLSVRIYPSLQGLAVYFQNINDRKRAEEEVRESHRLLRAVAEGTSDAIFVKDRYGRYLLINPAGAAMMGKAMEEMLGKDDAALFGPEEAQQVMRDDRQIIESGESRTFERTRAAAGVTRTFLVTKNPFRDEQGNVIGLIGISSDITARKEAEMQLRRRQQEFEALVQNAPDIIARFDRQCRHLYVNPAIEKATGIPPSQWIGKTKAQMGLPSPFGELWEGKIREVFDSGRAVEFEFKYPSPMGERYYHTRLVPEFASDGSVATVLNISRDVTARRRTEDALRESQRRLQAILDNTPAIVYLKDRMGRYRLLSRRFETIYHLTGKQVIGRTDRELFSETLAHALHANDSQVFSSRRPVQFEETVCSDGEDRTYLTVKFPLLDASGTPYAICSISSDITDQRRAEQLRCQKEVAEAANAAKDQFLAVLSHELRTPLTPVLMAASAMEMQPTLPPGLREQVLVIRHNVELEARLVDDLLDLTRIARGKLELRLQTIDAHDLLLKTLQIVQADAMIKQLAITLEPAAQRHHVRADSARLQQVFWNVLRNSVKFTSTGGRITIRSSNDPGGRLIKIEISDTGIGIEPQVLPKVFNAFEQGDASVTRHFGGMGLGLAIAKAIMDLHGGAITADSKGKEKGSTFSIELVTTDKPDPPNDMHPTGREICRHLRILLVEDHPGTAQVMRQLLAGLGHKVKAANDVQAALQLAEAEPFDLVISDLGLPDGSGHDLMRELQARHHLKGIALSGYGMEQDVEKSKVAGFSLHLTKPVDLRRLEEAIQQVST